MIATRRITLHTNGKGEIQDITAQVNEEIAQSGVSQGTVTLFVIGSTVALGTIEYESGLLRDFQEAWQRLVPEGAAYRHDSAWGRATATPISAPLY